MQNADGALRYNTELELIRIPEYGRHIQELIDHAATIEEPELQMAACKQIVKLMSQVTAYQGRLTSDVEMKLWRHLVIISNYKITNVPDGMDLPSPETRKAKPERVNYPRNTKRFRHYGVYVQDMIKEAIACSDQAKQKAYLSVIASYMKTAYMVWNRDPHISDEAIYEDLKHIVGNRMEVPTNLNITTTEVHIPNPAHNPQNKSNKKRKKASNNNNNQNRRRKRR